MLFLVKDGSNSHYHMIDRREVCALIILQVSTVEVPQERAH